MRLKVGPAFDALAALRLKNSSGAHFASHTVGKERQIAAKDCMRRQARRPLGTHSLDQVAQ